MTQLNYNDDLELDLQCYSQDCDCVDKSIESLESITLTQDLLTDGNPVLDQTAYKVVQHSMESLLKIGRIGVPSGSIVPSLESLSTRKPFDITQVALEGIGEGIKNVFLSIFNAIKKSIQWVWGLIKRLFTRNKEKQVQFEVIVEKTQTLKEEIKDAAPDKEVERQSSGWLKEIKLVDHKQLIPVVTSKGIMDKGYINSLVGQLHAVFDYQLAFLKEQVADARKGTEGKVVVFPKSPFPVTSDGSVIKAVKSVNSEGQNQVHASLEFGKSTYVVMAVPPEPKEGFDFLRDGKAYIDNIFLGTVSSGEIVPVAKHAWLKGDMCDPETLLENVKPLLKGMTEVENKLKEITRAKEDMVRELEAQIKKNGARFYSAPELKQERAAIQMRLKMFNKVMDQPGVAYYGQCDKVAGAYLHLAETVINYTKHPKRPRGDGDHEYR